MKKSNRFYLHVLHADRPDRPDDAEALTQLIKTSNIANLTESPKVHPRGGWTLFLSIAEDRKMELAEYLYSNHYRVAI